MSDTSTTTSRRARQAAAEAAPSNGASPQPDLDAEIAAKEAELEAAKLAYESMLADQNARLETQRKVRLTEAMTEADGMFEAITTAKATGDLGAWANAAKAFYNKAAEIAKAQNVKVSGNGGTRGTGEQSGAKRFTGGPTQLVTDALGRHHMATPTDTIKASDVVVSIATWTSTHADAAGVVAAYSPSPGFVSNILDKPGVANTMLAQGYIEVATDGDGNALSPKQFYTKPAVLQAAHLDDAVQPSGT